MISQSTADTLLLPVSENRRPPYLNSTSGFNFDLCVIINVSFCIGLPHFAQIKPNRWVMTSYRFWSWQPWRRKSTSDFDLCDGTCFSRSKSIYRQNFDETTHPRLKYYYVCFGKPSGRHIGIPLLVLILTYLWSRHLTLHRSTEFHLNQATPSGVMTSYRFSR